MIIEGDLPPGERIYEGQLGEEFGVSRTPLREAIKFLASEGLVELVPSRGAVVKRFGEGCRGHAHRHPVNGEAGRKVRLRTGKDEGIAQFGQPMTMVRHYKAGERLNITS